MARRRRSTSRRTTIVRAAAPIVRVSAPPARRYRHHVRRVGSSILGGVGSEKHTILAVGAAIGLGLLEKSGTKIPSIGPLGPAATAGIGFWIYGRMARNPTAQHMATGLLSVAMNRWAATGVIAGDEGVMGVFDDD